MVSTEWIIENIKNTNQWVNNRAFTEKALSEFLEFGVPMRIKYPDMTFDWVISNQSQRGTPFFDSIEKMIRVERQILGIIGVKWKNSTVHASKQTFNNLIITDTGESNPNFSIYNNKIKAEKIISDQKIAQQLLLIQNQSITFNEQTNSGDYNETPITDVNLSSGCSGCTGTEISPDPILRKGYHTMPDGSLMKDSDMEKEPLKVTAGMAGIAGIGIIGLLLYTRSVKK